MIRHTRPAREAGFTKSVSTNDRRARRPGRTAPALALVALAVLLSFAVIPPAAHAFDIEIIWVHPSGLVTLEEGESQLFRAYLGTVSSPSFLPDFGSDGEPGTDDDAFEPEVVDWELSGPPGVDLGTLAPATGESTTFTAPMLPEGGSAGSVSVLARSGTMIGGTGVMIVPRTGQPPPPAEGRLAFLDGYEEETDLLVQLRMGTVQAMFLAALTSEIARREALGKEATTAELRFLRQLVSPDHRHRLVARDLPPERAGIAVIATLTSYGPAGDVLDEVNVVLEIHGGHELRMLRQLVFVHPDTRSPRLPGAREAQFHFDIPTEADGLVFLTAVEGGRVVATAPGLTDGEGMVISAEP